MNIIPGVLTLSAALAIALTGNSLPFLQQGSTTAPVHSAVQCSEIVLGSVSTPWSCGNLPPRPSCDPPWTIALVTDGVWECAGGPGPVVLPSSPLP